MVLPLRFTPARLPLAALAALALSWGAAAQETDTSIAFCRVSSISRSAAVSQPAYTEAWLDIGNYVCGEQAEEPTIITINEQVESVASAIAEAFAEVSTNCRASGNAEVRAQGYSFAQDRAEALGSAVSEIFASAEVCGQCSAVVSALSETTQVLVAEAVAEAWTQLYLFSDNGDEVSDISTVTSSVIVETIATVLSSITGTIRAGADDGCSLEVINSAQVGDFIATCELIVSGDDRVVETDAIARAGAEASAYACGGDFADVDIDVLARATATALAEAVAQADIFCESNGGEDTTACGLAEADVRAVASAQAEAFASAFVMAETCQCEITLSTDVSVFDSIWVEAVVNAYAETCVVGNGEDFVTDFAFELEERSLVATARAIADAVADGRDEVEQTCMGTASACASNSENCVVRNGVCGGTSAGFSEVRPCCNPDFRCFRRNDSEFRCRHRNSRLPSSWDGRLEECTADLVE